MKLETAKKIWAREAKAHGYVGFLVHYDIENGYYRTFVKSKSEASVLAGFLEVLEEVYV